MNRIEQEIAIVTGSRADFGLLKNVCHLLDNHKGVNLKILVTGSHLSKKHGNTINEILTCGFKEVIPIDLDIDGDSAHDINLYISRSISGFSHYFAKTRTDKVLVLGDRYEVFGASIAASISQIKLAHIHGGEVTEGAFDEFIRHSITKMADLHFTSHHDYSRRIVQLGENPDSVFTVGGLGAENVEFLKNRLLSRSACESELKIKFDKKNLFVAFHPETNLFDNALEGLNQTLQALNHLTNTSIIFSLPNADTSFNEFKNKIQDFVNQDRSSRWAFTSICQTNYFSIFQNIDAVIGNSSSGILEAPSFKIATINIGGRQKGRIKGSSVIDVLADKEDIKRAIAKVYSPNFKKTLRLLKNQYYKFGTAENIVSILLTHPFSSDPKSFYDYNHVI